MIMAFMWQQPHIRCFECCTRRTFLVTNIVLSFNAVADVVADLAGKRESDDGPSQHRWYFGICCYIFGSPSLSKEYWIFALLRKDTWTAHVLHICIAEAYVRKKDRFDCTIPCTRAYQQWKENTIFTWD